jgi:hypothetical protein
LVSATRNPVARNPRREVAAVAAALLLPVPLLAATGVRLPLPAAVERGLASVTPGGDFDAPLRERAPARPDPAPAEAPAGESLTPAARTEGVRGASSVSVELDSGRASRDAGAPDRPEGGTETKPPGPGPGGPGTGPADAPGDDTPAVPPRESPPPPPATLPATPAPAEAPADLAVGLDAGGVSVEVEAGSDESGVTVSAGDLLPPTSVPVPIPLPLP